MFEKWLIDAIAMSKVDAEGLVRLGFNESPRGVHTSRTMMLKELESVMDAAGGEVSPDVVRRLVIEENLLGKATHSGRTNTSTKLIELYSFDRSIVLFRAFFSLWKETFHARPIISLLLALSRDAVLRTTVTAVVNRPIGSTMRKEDFYECLISGITSKYMESTLQSATRNVASSWRQSGHIRGNNPIVRTKAVSDFCAISFAVLIGYLRGLRGQSLLQSEWISILDLSATELESAIAEAHKHGFVTSRNLGGIIELTPGPMLVPHE